MENYHESCLRKITDWHMAVVFGGYSYTEDSLVVLKKLVCEHCYSKTVDEINKKKDTKE